MDDYTKIAVLTAADQIAIEFLAKMLTVSKKEAGTTSENIYLFDVCR